MRTLSAAWLLAALHAPLAAQGCGIFTNVTFTNYGQACGGAFVAVPALKGTLDTQACAAALDFFAPTGCCNVYFTGWVLVLGAQQTNVPILRPGCTLLASPDVAFAFTATTTKPSFPLPQDPALKGISILFQAAARYVGFYFGPDLSEGLEMKLR